MFIFIKNLKVADLKKELKSRGLPTTGNKNELVERLQGSVIGKIFLFLLQLIELSKF